MNIPSYKPTKDYRVYIMDIVESIERILEYTKDTNEMQFSQNIFLQDAVMTRFHIIGEAAAKFPKELRARFPDTPWSKIVAQRNFIIHDYAKINPHEIWETIIHDLPDLLPRMKEILNVLEKEFVQ
jgi:uncharacterized protein with HEPN domain